MGFAKGVDPKSEVLSPWPPGPGISFSTRLKKMTHAVTGLSTPFKTVSKRDSRSSSVPEHVRVHVNRWTSSTHSS